MNESTRQLLCAVAVTASLAACGGKPADTAPRGAAPAAAPAAATAATRYQGVPLYPGMTELGNVDHPAGQGGTLHSGNYSSNDTAEQIRAFYREQLGKLFGGQVNEDEMGEGMYRLAAGGQDRLVTILIHAGDSGGQVVGIQVASQD